MRETRAAFLEALAPSGACGTGAAGSGPAAALRSGDAVRRCRHRGRQRPGRRDGQTERKFRAFLDALRCAHDPDPLASEYLGARQRSSSLSSRIGAYALIRELAGLAYVLRNNIEEELEDQVRKVLAAVADWAGSWFGPARAAAAAVGGEATLSSSRPCVNS